MSSNILMVLFIICKCQSDKRFTLGDENIFYDSALKLT